MRGFWTLTGMLLLFLYAPLCLSQSATIVRLSGHVEILVNPSKQPAGEPPRVLFQNLYYTTKPATIGMQVDRDQVVRTGRASKVRLVYDEKNIISLSANTAFRLAMVSSRKKTWFDLLFGVIRAQVLKRSTDEEVQVRSRTMALGVRGTDFYMVDPAPGGGSSVTVMRGAVEISKPESPAETFTVQTGNTGQILSGMEPQKSIEVKPASQEELLTIQKVSVINKPQELDASIAAKISEIEQKAAEAVLEDIRVSSPGLFEEMKTTLASEDPLYVLNTMTVRQNFANAAAESNDKAINRNEVEALLGAMPPPLAPSLTSPEHQAEVPSNKVVLSWEAVAGAAGYDLELAKDQGFEKGLKTFQTDSTTLSIPDLNEGTYYWRVSSFDSFQRKGVWSEARAIVVNGVDKGPISLDQQKTQLAEGSKSKGSEDPQSRWGITGLFGIQMGSYRYRLDLQDRLSGREKAASTGGGQLSLRIKTWDWILFEMTLGGRTLDKFFDGENGSVDLSFMELRGLYRYKLGSQPWFWLVGLALTNEDLIFSEQASFDRFDFRPELSTIVVSTGAVYDGTPKSSWIFYADYAVQSELSDGLSIFDSTLYLIRGAYEHEPFEFPLVFSYGVELLSRDFETKGGMFRQNLKMAYSRQVITLKMGYAL